MADYLFFSRGAALDVYPSYNMTLAGLFWESLNYKMSVWDISLFFQLGSCWVLVHCTAPSLFLAENFRN